MKLTFSFAVKCLGGQFWCRNVIVWTSYISRRTLRILKDAFVLFQVEKWDIHHQLYFSVKLPSTLGFLFCNLELFKNVYLKGRHREKYIVVFHPLISFPKCLQQLGLDQTCARNLGIVLGLRWMTAPEDQGAHWEELGPEAEVGLEPRHSAVPCGLPKWHLSLCPMLLPCHFEIFNDLFEEKREMAALYQFTLPKTTTARA